MIRGVLDANVLISGLISRQGPPGRIIDAWLEERFDLFISPQIIEEVSRVLKYPRIAGRLESDAGETLIRNLGSLAEWVKGKLRLEILKRDPSDNISVVLHF